jgi:CubicO group peptidase (beta-lactamase class C family)
MKKQGCHMTLVPIVLLATVIGLFPGVLRLHAIDFLPGPHNQLQIMNEHMRLLEKLELEKKELDIFLTSRTGSTYVPSSSVLVIQGNRVIYKKAVNTTFKKRYGVASFTKTFTALAVLQLADQGFLSLDDPVARFIPTNIESSDLSTQNITIRHLLTHTAGFSKTGGTTHQIDREHLYIPNQIHPAGYHFRYSNQGYNLISRIITRVTGLSLGDYITANILIPLEMYDSVADSTIHGAGGMQCTAEDLGNYITMLLNKGRYKNRQIISEKSFNEIFRESVGIPPVRNKEFRGIAWRVWTVNGQPYSLNHAALFRGTGGWMQLYPTLKVGYLFMTDTPDYDSVEFTVFYRSLKYRLMKYAGHFAFDELNPVDFVPTLPSHENLQWFAGTYVNNGNRQTIQITVVDDRHLLATNSRWNTRYLMSPTTAHTFVHIFPGQTEYGIAFDFVWKNNKIVGLAFRDGFYIRQD